MWSGQPWTTVRNSVLYEVRQRYYLVRVPASEIERLRSGTRNDPRSPATIGVAREALAVTTDVPSLPGLLAELIADGPSTEPITADG